MTVKEFLRYTNNTIVIETNYSGILGKRTVKWQYEPDSSLANSINNFEVLEVKAIASGAISLLIEK